MLVFRISRVNVTKIKRIMYLRSSSNTYTILGIILQVVYTCDLRIFCTCSPANRVIFLKLIIQLNELYFSLRTCITRFCFGDVRISVLLFSHFYMYTFSRTSVYAVFHRLQTSRRGRGTDGVRHELLILRGLRIATS